MYKIKLSFTNLNTGVLEYRDCYFNLNKAELIELQQSKKKKTYSEYLQTLLDTQDNKKMIEEFKKLILKSYGVRSEDGSRFIKSKELSNEFEQTEMYSNLFSSIAYDEKAAIDFITGVIPVDMAKAVSEAEIKRKELLEKNKEENEEETKD